VKGKRKVKGKEKADKGSVVEANVVMSKGKQNGRKIRVFLGVRLT